MYVNSMYNTTYQQPFKTFQPTTQMQSGSGIQGVIDVDGIGMVEKYNIMPGMRVMFMDVNKDSFYVKGFNQLGIPEVDEYRFEKVERPAEPEYVKKADFDMLMAKLGELGERYESIIQSNESDAGTATSTNSSPDAGLQSNGKADGDASNDDSGTSEGTSGETGAGAGNKQSRTGRSKRTSASDS